MNKSVLAASVAALLLGGTSAFASSFTVEKQFSGNTFGPNGSESVTMMGGPVNVNATAGGFALKADPLGSFIAWCLDIAANLSLPSPYEVTTTPFTLDGDDISSKVGTIENLFETGYSTLDLTLDAHSAGFQLALWEILYEADGNAYELDGGLVTKGTFYQDRNTAGAAAAETKANALLAGLGGAITQDYELTFLQSIAGDDGIRSQNLVTVTAVPLPATALLLMAAIGGLGVAARKKHG